MSASKLYETRDFESFFRIYLRLHRRRETRIAHAVATTAMLICLAVAVATGSIAWLIAAPLIDYVIAQASHRVFEHNRTSPWRRPDYHLRAELRLYGWTLTGCLCGLGRWRRSRIAGVPRWRGGRGSG